MRKINFYNFFIRFVYYTYWAGLLMLLPWLLGLDIYLTPAVYLLILQRLIPLAGMLGVIPISKIVQPFFGVMGKSISSFVLSADNNRNRHSALHNKSAIVLYQIRQKDHVNF